MNFQGILFQTSLVFHFRSQSWNQTQWVTHLFLASLLRWHLWIRPVLLRQAFEIFLCNGALCEFTERSEQPSIFCHWLMNRTKLPQGEILMKACSSVSSGRKRRNKRESLVDCYRRSGEIVWFHMAEQGGHGRKGQEKNSHKGKKRKPEKGRRKI